MEGTCQGLFRIYPQERSHTWEASLPTFGDVLLQTLEVPTAFLGWRGRTGYE